MNSKVNTNTTETTTDVLMLGFLCVKDADNLVEKVSILDRF